MLEPLFGRLSSRIDATGRRVGACTGSVETGGGIGRPSNRTVSSDRRRAEVLEGNKAQGRNGFRRCRQRHFGTTDSLVEQRLEGALAFHLPLRRKARRVGVAGQRRRSHAGFRLRSGFSARHVKTLHRACGDFGRHVGPTASSLLVACAGRQQCRSGWPRGLTTSDAIGRASSGSR